MERLSVATQWPRTIEGALLVCDSTTTTEVSPPITVRFYHRLKFGADLSCFRLGFK